MTERMRDALLAFVCGAIGAWWVGTTVLGREYPPGIDGLYYWIQCRSILETGWLAYPDLPGGHLSCVALAPLIGVPSAWRVAAIFIGFASSFLGFILARRLGSDPPLALFSGVLIATGSSTQILAFEFQSNGFSICAVLAAMCLMRSGEGESKQLDRTAAAYLFLLVGAASHASGALLGAAFLLSQATSLRGRAALGLILAVPAGAAALRLFSDLHWSSEADWMLATRGGPSPLHLEHDPVWLMLVAVLGILQVVRADARRRRDLLVVCLLAALLSNPWLPTSSHEGLGPRLRLHATIALALSIPAVLGEVFSRMSGTNRWALGLSLVSISLLARPNVSELNRVRKDDSKHVVPVIAELLQTATSGTTVLVPNRLSVFAAEWVAPVEAVRDATAHFDVAILDLEQESDEVRRLIEMWEVDPPLRFEMKKTPGDDASLVLISADGYRLLRARSAQLTRLREQEPGRPRYPASASKCVVRVWANGGVVVSAGQRSELPSCRVSDPVSFSSASGIALRYGRTTAPTKPLYTACATAAGLTSLFQRFEELGVVEVHHMGSYNCRTIAGTDDLSTHAAGGAIDITGFRLGDESFVLVEPGWSAAEPGSSIEREIRDSPQASRVLGPGDDADHADHLHVEFRPEGRSRP